MYVGDVAARISTHALLAEGDHSLVLTIQPERIISTHALLAEGDARPGCAAGAPPRHFNPRPPCGGRHPYPALVFDFFLISTHALLAEGDQADNALNRLHTHFNPRPPCGGRPELGEAIARGVCISTHALLAEGDGGVSTRRANAPLFQPTPSLRRATYSLLSLSRAVGFQPTPSLRRATPQRPRRCSRVLHFNPRPPCGGRPTAAGA